MPLVDPFREPNFWTEQCSSRRDGLAHAHERDCTDGHRIDQCCECGRRASEWVAPPININERLGITTRASANEPQIPHPDGHPLELLSDAEAIVALSEGLGHRTARRRINNLRLLRWLYHERPEDVL